MAEDYQKTANALKELQLPHPGILSAQAFDEYFELHCYEPSADLKPFVVHIWTQRRRGAEESPYKPIEILSGPNMYLFFTSEAAFIHSVTHAEFEYDPLVPGVIAGVKFKPGGLYPFLNRSVSGGLSLESVFPEASETFRTRLLGQPEEEIVTTLEELLRNKHPVADKNLSLVGQILDALGTDASLQTVGAVSRAFDRSERSLQLLFQTYVGVGLKWIIARKRLLETIRRVQGQSSSWTEAAAELGYNSQSHFSREFRSVVGRSPSQYSKGLTQN